MAAINKKQITILTDHLFPDQELPKGFLEEFREYVQKKLDKLGCCALYVCKGGKLSQDFKNFLSEYPTLAIGEREVIIRENGAIDFIENRFSKAVRIA